MSDEIKERAKEIGDRPNSLITVRDALGAMLIGGYNPNERPPVAVFSEIDAEVQRVLEWMARRELKIESEAKSE